MINVISLALRFALPILEFFFKRSAKKTEMKQKMFQLALKYDEQVLKNARLRKQYEDLLKELKNKEA